VYPTVVGWRRRPGQADLKEGEARNVTQEIDRTTIQSSEFNCYLRVDGCGRMLIGL
jgi:hypothetical protein